MTARTIDAAGASSGRSMSSPFWLRSPWLERATEFDRLAIKCCKLSYTETFYCMRADTTRLIGLPAPIALPAFCRD